MTALLLLVSFVLIVGGALLFTNGVEWLGHKLNLGQSAVGSLLAAVGTALPESMIPIVALIGGGGSSQEIAIGSIIGAPFMLATVAMILVGASALAFRGRRESGRRLDADRSAGQRDLGFFLVTFGLAVGVGIGASTSVRIAVAVLLVIAYVVYSYRTVKHGGESEEGEEELKPLIFDRTKQDPPRTMEIALQVIVGLGLIVGGAELFVKEVEKIAVSLGVGPLVLSLILAPLATELPEKANSIIWVRENKDSLALGNVTGAMVFQATIPVAVGLTFTEWHLESAALAAGAVGLVGGALALVALRLRSFSLPFQFGWAALLVGFVVFAVNQEQKAQPPPPAPAGAPAPAPPPPPPAPPPPG